MTLVCLSRSAGHVVRWLRGLGGVPHLHDAAVPGERLPADQEGYPLPGGGCDTPHRTQQGGFPRCAPAVLPLLSVFCFILVHSKVILDTHTLTHARTHPDARTHARTHAHTFRHTRARARARAHTHTHTHTQKHTHTHKYTHTTTTTTTTTTTSLFSPTNKHVVIRFQSNLWT